MESKVALHMVTELCLLSKNKVFVREIVTDDDTIMRANLKHTKKGKLHDKVPDPRFLAGPSYRVKVMVKSIFAKATKTKDSNNIKTIDTIRLKKISGLLYCTK